MVVEASGKSIDHMPANRPSANMIQPEILRRTRMLPDSAVCSAAISYQKCKFNLCGSLNHNEMSPISRIKQAI